MEEYKPSNFLKKISETKLAQDLWIFLNQERIVQNLELATRLKHPAVEGIDLELIKEFGVEDVSQDTIKQYVGHAVRQILTEGKGYVVDQQNVLCNRSDLFTKGTRYKKYQPKRQ